MHAAMNQISTFTRNANGACQQQLCFLSLKFGRRVIGSPLLWNLCYYTLGETNLDLDLFRSLKSIGNQEPALVNAAFQAIVENSSLSVEIASWFNFSSWIHIISNVFVSGLYGEPFLLKKWKTHFLLYVKTFKIKHCSKKINAKFSNYLLRKWHRIWYNLIACTIYKSFCPKNSTKQLQITSHCCTNHPITIIKMPTTVTHHQIPTSNILDFWLYCGRLLWLL